MALRFLQIYIPEEANTSIDQILEGHEVLGTWRDASVEGRKVIHLLVPAEETEPIMDRFEQAYGAIQGFHIVLFPVEAVLPRSEADTEESSEGGEASAEAKQAVEEPGRVSREELYSDIAETLGINRVFVAMTVLSAVVAAVGLIQDNVAVVIGGMVIAPLLGPNIAMSLSTTLGDLKLLRRALLTNLVGGALALAVALMVGVAVPFNPSVPAIAGRTNFVIGDLALAMAAGSAGTFAFTRGLSGAVIGVMVAVALMPPLVTFGMLLGAGQFASAVGALILYIANVIGINLASVATFLIQGVRPRTWWEKERAKRAARVAVVIWLFLLAVLAVIVYIARS